jgi:hypothetical protein
MKRFNGFVLIPVLLVLILFAGCELFNTSSELNESVISDLEEMRAMIPAIEAGLMVTVPEAEGLETAGFGVMTYTPPTGEADPTPDGYYEGGTPDAEGAVRYPYTDGAFIEDLYGTAGNSAYLTLTPYDDTTLYTVDLYIYPTLSTEVNYIHEQYLVEGTDGTWALRASDGTASTLNYLVNETVYFDGRVQVNVVEWSRYSDGLDEYYPIPASPVPDDYESSVYDYPADPDVEPAKAAAGTGQYSAKIVSTIEDQGTEITEYYTDSDTDQDGLFEKFTISYVERNDVDGLLGTEEKTVRRSYVDEETGEKTVRARTASTITYGSFAARSSVVTEAVDIAENVNGAVTFSSTTAATDTEGNSLYEITVALTETGAGTNEFSGTVDYTTNGKTYSYDLTLDGDTGLEISARGRRKTNGGFNGMSRQEYGEFSFLLTNGGTFTGSIKGGVAKGWYKKMSEEYEVYLSRAAVMGRSNGRASARR